MLSNSSTAWVNYARHVLKWEGKTSRDPNDNAASCYPGGIHTNKGVTFCTFKQMAQELGITPVTHQRFLAMTDADVAKFMYKFYQAVNGPQLPDSIALLMTEAAWGSGPSRPWRHLFDALGDLGKRVTTRQQAIQEANKVNEARLFDAYNKRRLFFLTETLGRQPKFARYRDGWANRQNDFVRSFQSLSRSGGGGNLFSAIAAAFGFFFS